MSESNSFRIEPLYYLLIAIPIAIVLRVLLASGAIAVEIGELLLFLSACVAIIPLAGLMGRATEYLAETAGAAIGGLLNATLGNAAELIIALVALAYGKAELVKASITGSIIGNILLVLGLAMLVGGLRFPRQTFNRTAAGMGATLLALACVGLLMPTLHFHLHHQSAETISTEIAVVLAIVYLLSLLFSLKTHRHLFGGPEVQGEAHEVHWSRTTSIVVLLAATVGVAVMSEFLVGSIEHAAYALGMNEVFIGVIVVAVIGNAAEHSTAILVAAKDKMDLAMNIAIGSSLQIALFVAPVLVFASILMGQSPSLDLHFTPMEIIAVIAAMIVVGMVAQDGESHWMEGVMLLAVYIILALAFYNLPGEGVRG